VRAAPTTFSLEPVLGVDRGEKVPEIDVRTLLPVNEGAVGQVW